CPPDLSLALQDARGCALWGNAGFPRHARAQHHAADAADGQAALEAGAEGYFFLRRRRALATAGPCQGAMAAASVTPGSINASAERCAARVFSSTMRRYSAVLQLPSAIIQARRAIVSHDAQVNSAIINGSGGAARRRRLRFFIVLGCRDGLGQSATSFLLRLAGAGHRRPARRVAGREALLGFQVDELALRLGVVWAHGRAALFLLLPSIGRGPCCHTIHLLPSDERAGAREVARA